MPAMRISEATRRDVFDAIFQSRFRWYGRLSDSEFVKKAFSLETLHLTQPEFNSFVSSVWQHRVDIPGDWGEDWVMYHDKLRLLSGPDDVFLAFLTWTLHPEVQVDVPLVKTMVNIYNDLLRFDGVELYPVGSLANRPVYGSREVNSPIPHLAMAKELLAKPEKQDFRVPLRRLENALLDDPELAIGTAKEVLESCLKGILDEHGIEFSNNDDLPALMKSVTKLLRLQRDDISDELPAATTIKNVLSNLSTVVTGLAELRNRYGTGHGRPPGTKGPSKRHANLAARAAMTVAVFLTETNLERMAEPNPQVSV